MNKQAFFERLKLHWGEIVLCLIISLVIILNFKPGYLILGNDNFSPEINPSLTLERSIFSPGWRAYRAVGIASDSEQSDIFRTAIFWLLDKAFPSWFISQGYVFFTFFIASVSAAFLSRKVISKLFIGKFQQLSFLLGGIFYMASLLTSWIYFSPVHLFVAAYAFMPFVLWRIFSFIEKKNINNTIILLIASLLLSTSALTATMFFVCWLVIIIFSLFFFLIMESIEAKTKTYTVLIGLFIVFGIQSYWVFSFINYGRNNAKALQESSINRNITSTTLQTERKNNTWLNSLRYYFSWMETKENSNIFTFKYRDWYINSKEAQLISLIPIIFSIAGTIYLLKKRIISFLILPLMVLIGWFLIKGANPPFGFIYEYFQNTFPTITQVFRWQSSKFWPFLAITIPLLSIVGLLSTYNYFDFKKNPFSQSIKKTLIAIVVVAMLVFVYPYFKGDLIRDEAFVKIPKEYYHLANYLEKNNKFSRIYVAPEANTLYFRNYSWGFWGSVFLNYMIKNPIIEKALIIGSSENEQAFTVIKNSYYSEDPEVFASALRIYDADLVLFDGYATRGDVGYSYDNNISDKVINENKALEKIWQEGKLILYKLRIKSNASLEKVYFDTNPTSLNQIIARLSYSEPYYYKERDGGVIYPLALNFDSIKFTENEMIGEAKYKGQSLNWSFVLEDIFDDTPSQITFDNAKNELSFYPLLPYLQINKKPYLYDLPSQNYKVDREPGFIAINGQIVDYRKEGLKTVSTFYKDLELSVVRSFSSAFSPINLADTNKKFFSCDNSSSFFDILVSRDKGTECQSIGIRFDTDSIIELSIQLESQDAVRVTLCVESTYKKQCLNKNSTAYVNGDTGIVNILIPQSFQGGDVSTVYLKFDSLEKNDTNIRIKSFVLNQFENSKVLKSNRVPQKDYPVKKDIRIINNDTIYVHIPIYSGENSWSLKPNNVFIPESSVSSYSSNSITTTGLELTFKGKNGSGNIYPNIGFIDGRSGIGMAAVDSSNLAGIPLYLELHDKSKQFSIWDRQIFPKDRTNLIDLFSFPNKIANYKIEGKSESISSVQTENTLNNFVLQAIPRTWYSMKLSPQMAEANIFTLKSPSNIETNTYIGEVKDVSRIYAIPTANSKNWQLSIDGKIQKNSVVINGWQQGWEVGELGKAKVVYAQNKIIYMGFLPLVAIVGLVIVKISLTLLKKGG